MRLASYEKFFAQLIWWFTIYRWQNCFLYFSKQKALAQIQQSLLPSAKGLSFTFMLSQFTYFPPSMKQTLVLTLCINAYILSYMHHSYYFVLTIIHVINMLKLKAIAETFILLCVAFKLPRIYCLMSFPMQAFLILVLKVLFMKSFGIMIHLFNSLSLSLPRITSFITKYYK